MNYDFDVLIINVNNCWFIEYGVDVRVLNKGSKMRRIAKKILVLRTRIFLFMSAGTTLFTQVQNHYLKVLAFQGLFVFYGIYELSLTTAHLPIGR